MVLGKLASAVGRCYTTLSYKAYKLPLKSLYRISPYSNCSSWGSTRGRVNHSSRGVYAFGTVSVHYKNRSGSFLKFTLHASTCRDYNGINRHTLCLLKVTQKIKMSVDTANDSGDVKSEHGNRGLTLEQSESNPPEKRESDLNPPEKVRGMTVLDRNEFVKVVKLPALRYPVRQSSAVKSVLKKHVVKTPKIPVIDDDDDPGYRHLYLTRENLTDSGALPDDIRERLEKGCRVDGTLVELEVTLGYEHWPSYDVLRAILPDGVDVLSAFSRMGHLIHVNVRDNQLPYKYVIGQVLLDKNPGVKTVVNKVDTIDNQFRFFQLEVLAGDDDTVTSVKENGLTFDLDFARVYWNSRLGTEHRRLVETFGRRDVLYDVFAGIGPFSIPAAKKGCRVLANDLNPDSYRWLTHNVTKNKVADRVKTFNRDGREFISGTLKTDLVEALPGADPDVRFHVAMNLPALAFEFLDVFPGLLWDRPDLVDSEVSVHCYLFSSADDPGRDVKERIRDKLGIGEETAIDVHYVRNVAPNKEMMCASVTLGDTVLLRGNSGPGDLRRPSVAQIEIRTKNTNNF